MRFNRPTIPTGSSLSGGYSGIPSWRQKWIKEKARWIELECGHLEDLSIPVITFINAFDGTMIDCIECERFVKVKRVVKRKKTTLPDTPMF